MDHPRLKEYDLSSLEIIYYCAASFDLVARRRLREGIEKAGVPIDSSQFLWLKPKRPLASVNNDHEKIGARSFRFEPAGLLWPSGAMGQGSIANDKDWQSPCAEGEPGEICVQGPLLMSGYLNKPEQTAEAFDGGWLHTGDVAIRDPDGFLRIVDRKKDMIITGGFNVYPREVEDVLTSHPAGVAAAMRSTGSAA